MKQGKAVKPVFVYRIGETWCKSHNDFGADPMAELGWYLQSSNAIALSAAKSIVGLVPLKSTDALGSVPSVPSRRLTRLLRASGKFAEEA